MQRNDVIIIRDDEGMIQAVMQIPWDVEHVAALGQVRAIHNAVMDANPEEWNYGEVIAHLEAMGYTKLTFVDWQE